MRLSEIFYRKQDKGKGGEKGTSRSQIVSEKEEKRGEGKGVGSP